MRLKWIFGLGLFLVIALTATIYVVLSRYDYEHLKPQVAQQVKTATGRELTLAGPVKIHLGLRPALVAEDVSFQNAPWGSRPHMAKVKRLEIQLALIPLLSGTIDLKRLILIEPDIRIETNKAGESNLQFNAEKSPDGGDTPPKKPDAPSTALALIFDEVQVQKGRLTFSDQRSGRTHALSLDSIRLRARDRATVDLQVHGDYNGHRYQVTGSAGILASFMDSHMDSHEPWPVDLKARAGGTNVSVKGTFKNPLAGEGLKITVAGEGDSVPELLGLFEVAGIPEVGPFKVAGDFTNPGAKLTGENLDIQVGKKDLAQVRVTGSVDDLLTLGGIDAFVKADGPSVPRVLEIFHVSDVPDVGPFQVSGNLTNPGGRFQVHNLNLVLGSDALKDLPRVRVTGSVDDLLALGGIDAFVKADGPSVPRVLEIFHVSDVPDVGPFQVSGNLTNPSGRFQVHNLNLVLGSDALKDLPRVRVTGSVDDVLALGGIDAFVKADGPSVPRVLEIFHVSDVPDVGPFQVSGNLTNPVGRFQVHNLNLVLGSDALKDLPRVRVTGSVDDLLALGGIDAFVKADGPSVPQVLEIFHVSDVPDVGPFQVSGNLTNPSGTFKADNLNLVLGTEALAEVRLAGSVEDLQGLLGMDLDFSARGSDLAGLEKIVGAPLFTKGPFQVQGHALIPSRTDYELSDFKISVSGSDLAGTARLSLNGKVPHLEAALSSKRLDLRFLFPQEDQKSAETVSKSKRVLPQTPFPLEPLGKLDAKLAMQAKRIELPSFILDDLTTRIDLDDRHLAVAPCSFVAGSGAVDARLDVRPDGTSTALELVLKADHLDLGHMLKELGVNDVLAGILALDVDVSGRGATVADVLGGLNGRTVLIMKEGWINDRIMGFLGSDLGSSLIGLLNPAREESTGTDIRCLVSGLDIKDGSAETTVLVVDTSQVSVVGYGKLDLKTEALDLSLKPTPKKGLGIKGLGKVSLSLGELTKPLKLRGTLADPALAVDPAGTFVAIGKTVGGVALFGPFGLAAALAGGQFGDADPCDAAIEAVRKPPSEAPSQETHDNNTKKTTGGVGAGLKKIFGK